MKNLIMITFFLILTSQSAKSQVTTGSNSGGFPSDFVGWNSNTMFDLNIKHEGNYPIVFSTNNAERMRLTEDGRLLINQATSTADASLDVVGRTVGVRGQAVSSASNVNYGGWFTGNGSFAAYGVRGDALTISSGFNYGVAGTACNAQLDNYAVYGLACTISPGNWAGYFDGPAFTPGDMWTPSDENLKINVENLDNATDMLMSLDPKTYEFDPNVEAITLPEGLQYGFIAQEMAPAPLGLQPCGTISQI